MSDPTNPSSPSDPTAPDALVPPAAPAAPEPPTAPPAPEPTAAAPGYTPPAAPGYTPPAAPGYSAPAAPGYTPPAAGGYAPAPGYQPAPAAPFPIFGLISLIAAGIGFLGFASGFTGIFSLGGLVLGIIGMRRDKRLKGLSIAGIIVGAIGLLLNIVFLIIYIGIWIGAANSIGDYSSY